MKIFTKYQSLALIVFWAFIVQNAFGLNATEAEPIIMKAGSQTVQVSGPVLFYDDGGSNGKYSNGFNGQITFTPATSGQNIKIDFKEFKLGTFGYDVMKIYHGAEVNDDALVGEFNTDKKAGLIKSTATDGSLTVVFKGAGWGDTYLDQGWKAEVSAFTPSPVAFKDAVVSQEFPKYVTKGQKGVKLFKATLNFSGESGSLVLDKLNFSATGSTNTSSVTEARLYISDKEDGFDDATLFGETVNPFAETFSFSGNVEIKAEGQRYFWLVCDISADASYGDKIDVSLVSLKFGDKTVAIENGMAEGFREVAPGMKGVYTLDKSNGDFTTFKELVEALEARGLEGPVTVNVASGEYEEFVVLPEIKGASAQNTLTIRSATGKARDVKIINKDASADADGLFIIHGADFLTLEYLTFESVLSDLKAVVFMDNVSCDNVFRNNVVKAPLTVDYSKDIGLLETKAINEEGKNNDRFLLENNKFIGGYIGLDLGGTGYVKLTKETGHRIINNRFENQGSKSIYLNNQDGALVENNYIFNNASTKRGFQGMDLYRCIGNSVIRGNRVVLETKNEAIGVEMRPVSGSETSPAKFYNNMVSLKSVNASSVGVLLDDKCEYLTLAHNTVHIYGDTEGTALKVEGRSNEAPVKTFGINNIWNTVSGTAVWLYRDVFADDFRFENNAVNGSVAIAKIGDTEHKTIGEWNALSNVESNISETIEFVSDKNLQLMKTGNLQNGKQATGIGKDIHGDSRADIPTIGADEYRTPDFNAPEFTEAFPAVTAEAWNLVIADVKSTENANLFVGVLEKGAEAPTSEELKSKNGFVFAITEELTANIEANVELNTLSQNTEYDIYFLLEDYSRNKSDVVKRTVKTPFKPTQVSDFETEAIKDGDLLSQGTSTFRNITVKTENPDNKKNTYASIAQNQTATVRFTNTVDGIKCKGFYYKGGAVELAVVSKSGTSEKESLPAIDSWTFVDIRKKGDILGFDLTTADVVVDIDGIHGLPPVLTLVKLETIRVSKGETINVSPEVTGGFKPYVYSWKKLSDNTVFETSGLGDSPERTEIYKLTVTGDEGAVVSQYLRAEVSRERERTSFEELVLAKESFWRGNPGATGYTQGFVSGGYHFSNTYIENINTWGGFSYSNKTNKDESGGLNNQFTSVTGKGALDTDNYVVAYTIGDPCEMKVTHSPDGDQIAGMYVTNNTYALNSMLNGDQFAEDKFGGDSGDEPDWFKLEAEGFDSNGKSTGKAEFYLADFRFENNEKDYIVKDWRWFDLSGLGKVSKVRFRLTSSDTGKNGMNTPAYFCMDEVNKLEQKIDFPEPSALTYGDMVELPVNSSANKVLTFSSSDPSILEIVNGKATIKKAGTVTVTASQAGDKDYLPATEVTRNFSIDKATLTVFVEKFEKPNIDYHFEGFVYDEDVSALSGQLTYGYDDSNDLFFSGFTSDNYDIAYNTEGLTVITGIGSDTRIALYPNPATEFIRLNIPEGQYSLKVYDRAGNTVFESSDYSADSKLDVQSLTTGIYILKAQNQKNTFALRFSVR
ncbi:hypothetical protein FUAX_44350 (plasmid) [Fulvitalea axinellae]|uniref:Por secretion system C-terminal sorting domain-containing protein n=1 Tax=Fulvitalea axinellae TaxID=1182444 RepID=A0AAU9CVF9_9BACT|nr:hypothetical protein FUAX_44350 [Fulvitalea axinellae]